VTADLTAEVAPSQIAAGDLEMAAKNMAAVLESLGFDTTRDGVVETPMRFVRALDEFTRGRLVDPRRHLTTTFDGEGDGTQITTRRIPTLSLCEHHLLPFDGLVTISYLPAPGSRIVGLSKLARVAQEFAARATVQERVTTQIADAIGDCLDVHGVAVVIVSDHSCMSQRGARAHDADTITEQWRGVFDGDQWLRHGVLLKALTK
jgi:GTP cyclohydrolase I